MYEGPILSRIEYIDQSLSFNLQTNDLRQKQNPNLVNVIIFQLKTY